MTIEQPQWRPSTHRHPVTGAEVWFNQAQLFHYTAHGPEVGAWLLRQYGQYGLPRKVLIGDSEFISESDLAAIRKVYDDNMIVFDWQAGDVLVIDNELFANARDTFGGRREMLVGLTGTGN